MDEEEDGAQGNSDNDGSADDVSEDEMKDHKQQLHALAKTDPEFYKHLRENEPELLDFADDNQLDGIQLSESEDEGPRTKKQKTGKRNKGGEDISAAVSTNEVTLEMVERWHTGMTERHSLRQMKEVIMAFRAAVRSNEDEKEYKYSISDPDGMEPCLH